MSEAQINGYIALLSMAVHIGGIVEGNVRKLIAILHPHVDPSEADINAIEQGIKEDAERRRTEREEMGKPSE